VGTAHQQLDPKPFGLDSLSTSFNINRVSDDDYWRDFSHTPTLTSRQLTNEADLNWTRGDWSGQARTLSYQTLQYAAAPITPSYNRVPQITANYNTYDWHGLGRVGHAGLHALPGRLGLCAHAQRHRAAQRRACWSATCR
jgi:hypothetical protein